MFHQKHTQMPGKGRTDKNVVGQPLYPYFMAKTGAFFFFVFGLLALLGCLAQINPVWLYGPYNPVAMSSDSQPDFYMGMLEGALRIFPNWAWNIAGHTISWNVLIPALVPLGLLFTGAALWPFLERWITGDHARASRQRPAAERGHPHRYRHRGHHLVRDHVAGRRQRRDRRPLQHLAVHHHRDRAVRGRSSAR